MTAVSRKQAWCKLAVLIADGLPAPKSIDFHVDGEILSVDVDTDEAFERWHAALGLGEPTEYARAGSRSRHSYGDWNGYRFSLDAYRLPAPVEPEPVTEDLTSVREIAGAVSE